MRTHDRCVVSLLALVAGAGTVSEARAANEPVTFTDIAMNDGAGVSYRRLESAGEAEIKIIRTSVITIPEVEDAPTMGGGIAGVGVADIDNDGLIDMYVSNGPGRANSLYLNRKTKKGPVTFADVAVEKGCDATAEDGSGVVIGDIDNDGWKDILVLGTHGSRNTLYHNRGKDHGQWLGCEDWTFRGTSEIAGGHHGDGSFLAHTSATLGDFNNDGLLDVAIATTWDQNQTTQPIFRPFESTVDPNLLMINMGNGVFHDVTSASGFDVLEGFRDRNFDTIEMGQTFQYLHPDLFEATATARPATISWAIASVDMDVDGDADLWQFDDQAGLFPAETGGVDYGFIQNYKNVGTAGGVPLFENRTVESGTAIYGAWMGGSFADFDFNGYLDVFGTNYGAYGNDGFGPVYHALMGNTETRALYQRPDGTFEDRGVGAAIIRSAFGWGTIANDLDNDGDTDVVFRGGLDVLPYTDYSNPNNFFYRNDGAGNFEMEFAAFAQSANFRRTVHGVAGADFDNNGFVDVATVSTQDLAPQFELTPYFFMEPVGAPLDFQAGQFLRMIPTDFEEPDPLKLIIVPIYPEDATPLQGTVAVEMNGGNSNHHLTIEVRGMIGHGGRVNRDGIGAVVSCTPKGGKTAMYPVVAGSSFASQTTTLVHCGLGTAKSATVDVRWPGGAHNRRFQVAADSRMKFVEIPFSIDDKAMTPHQCQSALHAYLNALVREHEIDSSEAGKYYADFMRARAGI